MQERNPFHSFYQHYFNFRRIYTMKNMMMKNLTKSMTSIGEMLTVIGTL